LGLLDEEENEEILYAANLQKDNSTEEGVE